MNTRLFNLSGDMLFNRIWAVALGLSFLGFTLWRFTMTERAPSKRRLRRLAKRDAAAAKLAAVTPTLGGGAVRAADARPSRLTQFMTRLRVETRQVLTSPGLFILTLFAIGNTATFLWFGQSAYGTADHPIVSATIARCAAGRHHPADDRRLLRRRAGVARARPQDERTHRFDALARLGHGGAQDARGRPGADLANVAISVTGGAAVNCSRAHRDFELGNICSGTSLPAGIRRRADRGPGRVRSGR